MTAVPVCDHKSVGVLIGDGRGSWLMFRRVRFPVGIAPAAGHVDGHGGFAAAARAEVDKELGLQGIDRYRLARHLVWVKNHLAPASGRPPAWSACSATGYSPDVPTGLAIGLLIVADNTSHLIINTLAVMWQ